MKSKEGTFLHYDQVTISMYLEDIRELDALVQRLKENGNRRANRSALIRYAIECVRTQSVETINHELAARRRT